MTVALFGLACFFAGLVTMYFQARAAYAYRDRVRGDFNDAYWGRQRRFDDV